MTSSPAARMFVLFPMVVLIGIALVGSLGLLPNRGVAGLRCEAVLRGGDPEPNQELAGPIRLNQEQLCDDTVGGRRLTMIVVGTLWLVFGTGAILAPADRLERYLIRRPEEGEGDFAYGYGTEVDRDAEAREARIREERALADAGRAARAREEEERLAAAQEQRAERVAKARAARHRARAEAAAAPAKKVTKKAGKKAAKKTAKKVTKRGPTKKVVSATAGAPKKLATKKVVTAKKAATKAPVKKAAAKKAAAAKVTTRKAGATGRAAAKKAPSPVAVPEETLIAPADVPAPAEPGAAPAVDPTVEVPAVSEGSGLPEGPTPAGAATSAEPTTPPDTQEVPVAAVAARPRKVSTRRGRRGERRAPAEGAVPPEPAAEPTWPGPGQQGPA